MSESVVEKLVGNLSDFDREYWMKKPRVHTSSDSAFVQGLFTLAEADRILASPGTRPPYVEVKRGGQGLRERSWTRMGGSRSIKIRDTVHTGALAREFSKGSTLIFNHLDDFHDTIRSLCEAFQLTFRAPTKTVAFITPPDQPGLGLHYDTFEGFIVQTHGIKRWYVYDQMLPLTHNSRGLRPEDVGEPCLEVLLRPGDCLYIPWGSPHHAVSEGTVSCHVTVMCVVPAWVDVIVPLLKRSVPQNAYNVVAPLWEYDEERLVDEAHAYLQEVLRNAKSADMSSILADAISRQAPTQPARAGFLQQKQKRSDLGLKSRVTRNQSVAYQLTQVGERIEIRTRYKTLRMPRDVIGTLAELDLAADTPIRDVVSPLPDSAKLALIGHLVDNGILLLS